MGIQYRPEIDGLRAVAVLGVMAFHAGLGGAGYVGVDVFFVISGYLITTLLLREWRETGRLDLAAFYARRVRRIMPAATVVVLAVLALSGVLLPVAQQAHTANSAGAALVFGANVFFQLTSGGYFDGPAAEMPLLHLWSLSVEEQFYFLWPVLLAWLLRRPRWLPAILAGLALASFALAEAWIGQGSSAAFYQMPARFWELAAGGLVAASPVRRLPRWALPTGLLATLAACVFPMGGFPGAGALPAVLGAALLLAAVHGGATSAFLRSGPMVRIGLLSYSLYLWHWPLLAFYQATTIGEGELETRLLLCAIAFPLAFASHRYVEQPFRRLRFASGRTVAAGAIVSAALCACAFGIRPDVPPSLRPDRACHSRGDEPASPKCVAGNARSAVWGDSMAYAWSPVAGVSFTRDACPPLLGYPQDEPRGLCAAFNIEAAKRAAEVETVYLAARWRLHFPGAAAEAGLRRTLDALERVPRVVIIGPTPEMREDVPRCVEQQIEARCAIPRARFDAEAAPVLASLGKVAAAYRNVEVLDMADRFCTRAACPPARDGVPLYWDTHHVATPAALDFAPSAP